MGRTSPQQPRKPPLCPPPALGRDCLPPYKRQLRDRRRMWQRAGPAAASPPSSRQTRSHTIAPPRLRPAGPRLCRLLTPHSFNEHWGTHSAHCFHGMKIQQAKPPLYPQRSLGMTSGPRGASKQGPLSWSLLIPLATSRPTHSTPIPVLRG